VLDHLGTPLLITNPQGGSEALHSYFPFGEELFPDRDTERMKFTGHERDLNRAGQVDDLDYMHARYCSPLIGRFLSIDKARSWRLPLPQTWNRYAYARGNPLKYVDPDGLQTVNSTAKATTPIEAVSQLWRVATGAAEGRVLLVDAQTQQQLQATSKRLERFWTMAAAAVLAGAVVQALDPSGQPVDRPTKDTKNWSADFQSEREARAFARQKVGSDPIEVGPGKLRSQDGKWQYRAKPEDLEQNHIHLEELDPETGEVKQNLHLRWSEEERILQ